MMNQTNAEAKARAIVDAHADALKILARKRLQKRLRAARRALAWRA